jgi:hypothetical protein
MEQDLLSCWEGADRPSRGRLVPAKHRWRPNVATDYDLACDVNEWAGIIQLSEGTALVVSIEHLATTWIPDIEDAEGALVEWGYGESETQLVAAARRFIAEGDFSVMNEFHVNRSPLILFDSAERGDEDAFGRLKIEVSAGKYTISSGYWKTEQASAICHVFRLNKHL